ncbi:MAG TPA: hypothetical protein DEP51_04400 [Clostridiales bacterium]|nr:hypothetical protein [Clostridiales bacterium]
MISFLSSWIGQIAVSVIIVSIFEIIIPNGNLKKYIKVVLGIYIVYCMITPFVNKNKLFDIDDLDIKKYTTNNISKSNINQESMDKRLEVLYIDELEKNINNKLNEYGYEIYKCKIDANLKANKENPGIHKIDLIIKNSQNNQIQINEVEIGNSIKQQEKKDINIEQIKQLIADYLEINQNIISIKIK